MNVNIRISILSFCAMVSILLWAGSVIGAEGSSREVLLAGDFMVDQDFEPGLGLPIGQVDQVRGEAVIIHAGDMKGYFARKDLPLYKGDRIVTKNNGNISLNLNDRSLINLTFNTSLELNESVYDSKKKSRFSFFKMALGKARFLVMKMSQFKRSEFKVKTPTAVVGVRGSDFIIVVEPDRTEVTALDETVLEVISLADPSAAPTILQAFEKTMIEEGKLATEPETVSPEEIMEIKQEAVFSLELIEPGDKKIEEEEEVTEPGAIVEPVEVTPEEAEEEKKEETLVTPEEAAPGVDLERKVRTVEPGVTLAPDMIVSEYGVLVSEDELVDPGAIIGPEEIEDFFEPDIVDEIEQMSELDEVQQEQEAIEEIIIEEEVVQELPGFPGTP